MDGRIRDLLTGILGERERSVRSYMEGGSFVIDCRGCQLTPLPGSEECIGCIVREMSVNGTSDRIVLRTGRDTEISGRSGRCLRDMAGLMRWSMPRESPKGRCSGCDASRYRVMERAWATFPKDGIGFAREMLGNGGHDTDQCRSCRESTARALDLLEERIGEIIDRMVDR